MISLAILLHKKCVDSNLRVILCSCKRTSPAKDYLRCLNNMMERTTTVFSGEFRHLRDLLRRQTTTVLMVTISQTGEEHRQVFGIIRLSLDGEALAHLLVQNRDGLFLIRMIVIGFQAKVCIQIANSGSNQKKSFAIIFTIENSTCRFT